MGRIPEEIIEEARRVDVVALAGDYTTLRLESKSKGEWSGPCPNASCSADDDGFRVFASGGWFCRKCQGKGGNAITFLRWLKPALSFGEVIEELTGRRLDSSLHRQPRPQRKAVTQPPQPPDQVDGAQWRAKNVPLVDAAHERLWSHQGEPGQAYLLGRYIEPHAWLAYKLGFDPSVGLPGTKGGQRAPAIVIPWYAGERLVAVRYRFLEKHSYSDADQRQRNSVKQTAAPGSQFAGHLYGGHALFRGCEAYKTLFVFEGELNAISAWLVAQDTRVDVLSLGSEGQQLSEAAIAALQKYRAVFFWVDQKTVRDARLKTVPGSHGLNSPGGKDANDLLAEGTLGAVLSLKRLKVCMGDAEREALLWDLWDAALPWQGIDTGTEQVIEQLSTQLGKSAPLREVADGVWKAAVGAWERERDGAAPTQADRRCTWRRAVLHI